MGARKIDEEEPVQPGVAEGDGDEPPGSSSLDQTVEAILAWLVIRLSELSGVEAEQIDVQETFVSYGLGSVESVTLAGELEDWLGRKLPATLVWDYPTPEALARHLAAGQRRDSQAGADAYKN